MIATDELFRLYDPATDPFDGNGYPLAWGTDIKYLVRQDAGHRCVRCGHPYVGRDDAQRFGLAPSTRGDGWSRCDDRCTHGGPVRTHRDHVEAAWRILTVHHLDGDKANCRWWNLSALCQRCHLQVQGKVVMARVWPWEHSTWFKPFVAGYYAHSYLGVDLTRDETMARLDELLALERTA